MPELIAHEWLTNSFGARIYLGSREGYSGREISEEELIKLIGDFQHADTQHSTVVRLTRTTFLWDHYVEPGWEIGLMNYPKGNYTPDLLHGFAKRLAEYLVFALKQNRVTVEWYNTNNASQALMSETVMYEHPQAEQSCAASNR